ncbi:LOW QUALITY PROTEIN: Photosystem I PsaA/PsaB, partial [Dillenia turbinata]
IWRVSGTTTLVLFAGWFHYHEAAPKLTWFQDIKSILNHHLAGLLGLGSLFLAEGNMNVLSCSINTLKVLYDISGVEVGQHFYWQIGDFQVHAQVLITSWVEDLVTGGESGTENFPPFSAQLFGLKNVDFKNNVGRESGTKSRQTLNIRYDLKITEVKVASETKGDKIHHREGNSSDHQLRPLNDCSMIKEVGLQRQ